MRTPLLALAFTLILLGLMFGTDFTSAPLAAEKSDDIQRERDRGESDRNAFVDSLEGKPAPKIFDAAHWMNTPNGEPLSWSDLEGNVVLIDFWGVWCGPCRRAIPHVKELAREHADDGLVVLGIHTASQAAEGRKYVVDENISYPVAFDDNKAVIPRFGVDSYPDYYLVDHNGVLRFADLANSEVDRAVEMLLAERAHDQTD